MVRRPVKRVPPSRRQYVLQSPALQAARRLPGVKAGPMPGFVEPSLATLRPEAPRGERWVHEIKYDGYRLQLHVHNGSIRLFTRRGHNWTDRFESIVIAASSVKTYAAILDGEVIVPTEQGRSDFHALERDLGAGRSDRFVYYCFDLLYLDGLDLRACALLDHKEVLAELLVGVPAPLGFSEHLGADGRDVLANACRLELEGVVSKLKDGRYRSGRNDDWVKATCRHRDTFAIAGWAEKQGKFDGLYLARNEEGELTYAGKLERGFSEQEMPELLARLEPLRALKPPMRLSRKFPQAKWVRPEVMVDAEYRGRTGEGLLRHPLYQGIRQDLMDPAPRRARRASRRRQRTAVPARR